MLKLISLLVLFSLPVFADDIRFHNLSDQTVEVAASYGRDESVFAINGGYTDKFRMMYTEGFFILGPRGKITIDEKRNVKVGNDNVTVNLTGIRVVTGTDSDHYKIVHPSESATPFYAPAHLNPQQTGWYFRALGEDGKVEDQIARWKNQGYKVDGVMFYQTDLWKFKDGKGGTYYGVGMSGTESLKIIDEYWQKNSKFTGYNLRIVNNTGQKQDFKLSYYDGVKKEWIEFTNYKTAEAGQSVEWHTDEKAVVRSDNYLTTYEVKVESKDFYGKITTWNAPLKVNRTYERKNGTVRPILSFNLN